MEYGSECGKAYTKLKTIKKPATRTFTVKKIGSKKLKKGKYYRFVVVAIANHKGQPVQIAASKSVYIVTNGGKYSNYTGIKVSNVKKNSIVLNLKNKKTFSIKAAAVKTSKTKVKTHRKLCYESTDLSVAKVSKKGKVTAVGKGKCFIYIYLQDGRSKKLTIKVK